MPPMPPPPPTMVDPAAAGSPCSPDLFFLFSVGPRPNDTELLLLLPVRT
jgi:hypothetical protein